MARLPGWLSWTRHPRLHPWRTVRSLTRMNLHQAETIRAQSETAGHLRAEIRSLQRDLRVATGYAPGGQLQAGDLDVPPEFVLVGRDRAGQGKRVMASKELGKTSFGIEDLNHAPTWRFSGFMPNMLVIDGTDYQDALGKLMKIWANWLSPTRGLPAGNDPRPHGTAAHEAIERHAHSLNPRAIEQ